MSRVEPLFPAMDSQKGRGGATVRANNPAERCGIAHSMNPDQTNAGALTSPGEAEFC